MADASQPRSFVDIISVNIYPYWDGVDISTADINSIQKYNHIKLAISKGKPVIISELGWPTAGQVQGNAVPSPENAEVYQNKMRSLGSREYYPIFLV